MHLFTQVHSYDPYPFCGTCVAHHWSAEDIDGWAAPLALWSTRRQIAVLLGEFGCNKTQSNATGRLAWYAHISGAARKHGFAATVWDDDGAFGMYDRATGAWDEPVLRALGLGHGLD